MGESEFSGNRFRLWRRKWLIAICFILLVLLMVPIAWFVYRHYSALAELHSLIAELDKSDPGWRLEQMMARRKRVPNDENAALVVKAAHKLLPKEWASLFEKLEFPDHPPQLFGEKSVQLMRDGLIQCRATTDELAKLHSQTKGQYSLKWYGTVLAIEDDAAFDLNWIVQLRTIHMSQSKQPIKAWRSAFLLWKMGDIAGDEACASSKSRKMAGRTGTIIAIERVLAQGEVTGELLEATQDKLRRVDCQSLLKEHARAKRAELDHLYSRLENGDTRFVKAYNKHMHSRRPKPFEFRPPSYEGSYVISIHIAVLKFYSRAMEIFNIPPPSRYLQLSQLREEEQRYYDKFVPYGSTASFVMGEGAGSLGDSYLRFQAKLDCARAGLGCERFRLKFNRWPSSLEELVECNLLQNVPIDPVDGNPLRYSQSQNGIVIYSISFPQSHYNGGSLDDPDARKSYNSEFRLWNKDKRRQVSSKG